MIGLLSSRTSGYISGRVGGELIISSINSSSIIKSIVTKTKGYERKWKVNKRDTEKEELISFFSFCVVICLFFGFFFA